MALPRIDSKHNPRIVAAAKLLDRKTRSRAGLFLIEGWRLVKAALEADAAVEELYLTPEALEREGAGAMVASLLARNVAVFETAPAAIERLSDTVAPQGVVAVARRLEARFEQLKLARNPLVLVADGVSDPGNFGSLARIAGAAKADAIVALPGTVDWTSPKVLRASMGGVFHAPIVHAPREALFAFVERRRLALGVTVSSHAAVFADANVAAPAPCAIYDADLTKGVALVFGNEAYGASAEIRQHARLLLTIPMPGPAESLNVVAAAAITVFEALRQRRAT